MFFDINVISKMIVIGIMVIEIEIGCDEEIMIRITLIIVSKIIIVDNGSIKIIDDIVIDIFIFVRDIKRIKIIIIKEIIRNLCLNIIGKIRRNTMGINFVRC